ncbi:SpoIVB peptidase [Halobacillus naozhouensis]|uniref:SpoIVB peptidase n=2 Tax=Halobacillus naozhouensis TaxID=554880 RepID=A0ABY8J4H1_9BACI|nr:SpoIVB peptidase [Halobacillus naozhouensis]WFT76966.1 SpoIVB peptidase [Halobacillus naozhouensis]
MLALPLFSPFQEYLSIPTELRISTSQSIESSQAWSQTDEARTAFSSDTVEPNTSEVFHEFAGIPLKKTDVRKMKDIRLVPGGHSVGVQLQTKGVLVVGHHLVNENKEESTSPGEKADIQVGDILLKGNGEELNSMEKLSKIVEKSGDQNEPVELTVKRGEETFQTSLTPSLNKKDDQYQIGLYVRDSAAGIGTMTFYHPDSGKYGALGHVIADMDTRQPIEINKGTIVESNVTSIEKGSQGVPGEKRAEFSLKEDRIGTITENSAFGIFGKLDDGIINEKYPDGLPVGYSEQVEEGPAKILTVLEGEKLQEFDVEIVSNMPKDKPVTKGMIVKITDPELLKKTGGIVQGMSGSPIIQNGKIIGAVTHVFVNDPTSGYGVHIEWMLKEAGVDIYKSEEKELNKAG